MKLAVCRHIVGKDIRAMARHNGDFHNLDLSKEELGAAIEIGWPFCAQHSGTRKSENFAVSGFLAVDVDRDLRLEDAMDDPFFTSYAGLLYTTANHTADAHRFRIVFELQQPLTERDDMTAALSGLAYKFKGDQAATDACRVFFGNPACSAEILENNTLPESEVRELIQFARDKAAAGKYMHKAGSSTRVRSRLSIPVDAKVRTASRSEDLLWDLPPGTRVFCPNHVDHSPSAFVVRSRDGKPGISCSACMVTMFPERSSPVGGEEYLSDDLKDIVEKLRMANDGSGVPWSDCYVRVVTERHLGEPDAPPERLPSLKTKTR